MGFRISWLAAKDMRKADLLKHFQLVDTERRDEANEADFSVAELPTGWSVLWSNDPTFARIAICQPISQRRPVVSCWVNETAMVSSVNYFSRDTYWFAGHDANADNPADRDIQGEYPAEFQDIVDQHRALQVEADRAEPGQVDYMFDAPIEMARRLCGFRHDLIEFDWGVPHFTAAESAATVTDRSTVDKRGWFARLFDR
ncbi:hypothetical protein ACVWZA_000383 [Sphingomonas sp. UYAg733]